MYNFYLFDEWTSENYSYQSLYNLVSNHVWFSILAFVMPKFTIGDKVIIGSCSVVTKDVKLYSKVAGSSQERLIRKKFANDFTRKLLDIKWLDWNYIRISKNIKAILGAEIGKICMSIG